MTDVERESVTEAGGASDLPAPAEPYDSTGDTLAHIDQVRSLLEQVVKDLRYRAAVHDASKLQEPEKPIFDEYTPKLRESTYGSDEYKGFLVEMAEGLHAHYSQNPHHPEYGEQDEEWRPVVDFESHYEVSNLGDVRSLTRVVPNIGRTGRWRQGQPMAVHVNAYGYRRLQLTRENIKTNVFVHVLVARAFVPNPDDKPEVNHKDGDKTNNRATNLEWATRCDNVRHARDTGLVPPAAKWIIYCVEEDIATFGATAMERELRKRGYTELLSPGIYQAAVRSGQHCNLHFESITVEDGRRSRMAQMSLLDVIEMLADWKAATLRHKDGSLDRSITQNRERFGYGDEIERLLRNTAERLGWLAAGNEQNDA